MPKTTKKTRLHVALEEKDMEALRHVRDEFRAESLTEAVRICIRYMAEFSGNSEFWEWAAGAGLLLPRSVRVKEATSRARRSTKTQGRKR